MRIYWHWLLGLSVLFVLLERVRPRDPEQGMVRRGLLTDLAYTVVNGHWLGVGVAIATAPLADALDAALAARGLSLHLGWVSGLPFVAQLVIAFFVIDLMQWGVHRLLHRVPLLWRLHQVHHSIVRMDFLGSLRFHFGEVLVYKTLLYLPMALLGFDGAALFWLAVVSTAIGHLNHANVDLRFGPLVYFLNGPEMHVWHHAHPDAHPELPAGGVNFAIDLSLWDWLFGTAHLPADRRPPRRLGFRGVERYPEDPLRQLLAPLTFSAEPPPDAP
jgi:sterol desaturase/sphingolipid hydroxylase (fatty acid hydroxylase superfamily)